MKTADYDYYLPQGLVAARPAEYRDRSRLMVLHKDGGIEHRRFSDLPSYLAAGDMLILNNSKVFPARLTGRKPTGGKIDFLLVSRSGKNAWHVLSRESYTGMLAISDKVYVQMVEGKTAVFDDAADLSDIIWTHGRMPLPPYIRREPDETDRERYQTVYAEAEGSIAAPTAGLHFTVELLHLLERRAVRIRSITLHVGTGTFRPIKAERIADHRMDEEQFEITANVIREIGQAKQDGHKVVAVGTTSTRTLEGYFSGRCSVRISNGTISGSTDIFIYEGHQFLAVDALITNFHLPRSSPLMLAAAFSGREKLLKAYTEAVSGGYRFFSYGDAMLVL